MTPEQLAARWLADCRRFQVPRGVVLYEADALAAIARHLAPGDDLVERLQSMGIQCCDLAAARIAALTATVAKLAGKALMAEHGEQSAWQDLQAERSEAATLRAELNGPISDITDGDFANIVAHLSYELEPKGPLPNRNSVFMDLVRTRNENATLRDRLARMEEALDDEAAQEVDRLRLKAFATNAHEDRLAYYKACSGWFQNRHTAALTDGGSNE